MSEATPPRRNRFRRARSSATETGQTDNNAGEEQALLRSDHASGTPQIEVGNADVSSGGREALSDEQAGSRPTAIDAPQSDPTGTDAAPNSSGQQMPRADTNENGAPDSPQQPKTPKSPKTPTSGRGRLSRGLFGRRRRSNSMESDGSNDEDNVDAQETDQLVPRNDADGSTSAGRNRNNSGEDNSAHRSMGNRISRFRKGRKGKREASPYGGTDALHSADDEERPGAKDNSELGCCSWVQFSVACSMGYTMDAIERHRKIQDAHPSLYLERDAHTLAVGALIHGIDTLGDILGGIVKPMVKVHAVSMSTGYYIKSKKLPVAVPLVTRPCSLHHISHRAVWNQEMVFDAYFTDLAKEDTLLLFEVLDDKPSLSSVMNRGNREHKPPIAKRVAWAYLLPIGITGNLNIGFSDGWKAAKRINDPQTSANNSSSGNSSSSSSSGGAEPRQAAEQSGAYSELTGDSSGNDNSNTEDGAAARNADQGGGNDNNNSTDNTNPAPGADASGDNSSANTTRRVPQKYPWDEPSADKKMRLQLHYYRKYDGVLGFVQRKLMGWPALYNYSDNGESSYPNGIPEVYVQWRLQRRFPVRGAYLRISLGPRPVEMMPAMLSRALGAENALAVSQKSSALSDDLRAAAASSRHGRRGRVWGAQPVKSQAELNRLRAAVMKRTRGNRERCVVPDRLLYRLDAGNEGAMVVSFSTSGHILAVASRANATSVPLSNEDTIYSLRLFDTDMNEEIWVEDAAHHAVIYEIKWTRNDRYLLTCSGDGTCKVWDMISLASRSSNQVGFSAATAPPSVATGGGEVPAGGSITVVGGEQGGLSENLRTLINKPPFLVCTLAASPPVYTYCATFTDMIPAPAGGSRSAASAGASAGAMGFTAAAEMTAEEHLTAIEHAPIPRIITGAADGRIRVWDGGELKGFIHVSRKGKDVTAAAVSPGQRNNEEFDFSPHDGAVNSLVIDERSKYLVSADSVGDILAWRLDSKGWYQLLRKFKRDANTPGAEHINPNMPFSMGPGGVLSLVMHPEKHKGQMLALSRQPAQLRLINMSTYKTQCFCEGFVGLSSGNASSTGGGFFRAAMSADGRFVICGSSVKAEQGKYRLQVWDSQTGHVVRTPLAEYIFPYPVRSVSWHPAQHLLAVAMVGLGAAVVVYSGDREVLLQDEDASFLFASPRADVGGGGSLVTGISPRPNTSAAATTTTGAVGGAAGLVGAAPAAELSAEEQAAKQDRAREMLAKIKAAKQAKKDS